MIVDHIMCAVGMEDFLLIKSEIANVGQLPAYFCPGLYYSKADTWYWPKGKGKDFKIVIINEYPLSTAVRVEMDWPLHNTHQYDIMDDIRFISRSDM